jgi:hypothetical protein
MLFGLGQPDQPDQPRQIMGMEIGIPIVRMAVRRTNNAAVTSCMGCATRITGSRRRLAGTVTPVRTWSDHHFYSILFCALFRVTMAPRLFSIFDNRV